MPLAPLSGGDIAGWGQLEGQCVIERREAEVDHLMVTAIRNETGGVLSVASLESLPAEQTGQDTASEQQAQLAESFNSEDRPLIGSAGATAVRRTDRKLAAFRIVHRDTRDHCEFDISVVIEP